MSRIYPDWVGPTSEYRTASRFPHWIHLIGGILPSIPEGFLGGVEVLFNPLDVRVAGELPAALWRRATEVAITLIPGLGAIMTGKPGVKVKDEDTGV